MTNVTQMAEFIFDRVGNIVEKGENSGHHRNHNFPLCFHMPSLIELLQFGTVWLQVKSKC